MFYVCVNLLCCVHCGSIKRAHFFIAHNFDISQPIFIIFGRRIHCTKVATRKSRDAAAVLVGLKFADNISLKV